MRDLVFGSFHKMAEFYDEYFKINYKEGEVNEDGFLEINISPDDDTL